MARSLPLPRNAFAAQASARRASWFHDRRAPRGGARNHARELLDEVDELEEALALEHPPEASAPSPDVLVVSLTTHLEPHVAGPQSTRCPGRLSV